MRLKTVESVWRCALLIVVVATVVGCNYRARITSAQAHQSGDVKLVEVEIPSGDAATIKRRELYFSVVVLQCGSAEDGYPVTPYIDGERASDFNFATTGDTVKIAGSMPAEIFDRYAEPCAFLRGGGYLSGKLTSSAVPITAGRPDVR